MMGALGLIARWGIVSYRKRYQMSLSAQISCVGVESRFSRSYLLYFQKQQNIHSRWCWNRTLIQIFYNTKFAWRQALGISWLFCWQDIFISLLLAPSDKSCISDSLRGLFLSLLCDRCADTAAADITTSDVSWLNGVSEEVEMMRDNKSSNTPLSSSLSAALNSTNIITCTHLHSSDTTWKSDKLARRAKHDTGGSFN